MEIGCEVVAVDGQVSSTPSPVLKRRNYGANDRIETDGVSVFTRWYFYTRVLRRCSLALSIKCDLTP